MAIGQRHPNDRFHVDVEITFMIRFNVIVAPIW